jgi:curved DNA-binding protein CbpA
MDKKRVPGFKKGIDISKLSLNPKEGFVLSRVDGKTTLELISSISGLPIEEILSIFAKLEKSGAIEFKSAAAGKTSEHKEKPKEKYSILEQLEEDEKYESLNALPREDRGKILLYEQDLENSNYYELLSVARGASEELIKKAYFKLTKDFHPDRFFGKELGLYKKKLEKIFQKITDAYETLIDQQKRRHYDAITFPKEVKKTDEGKKDDGKPRPQTLIERLASAKKYYELGQTELKKKNSISAASYFKLAISYDPSNKEYLRAYEKAKPALDKKRGRSKFEEAIRKKEFGDIEGAIELLEEAVSCDPESGEYNYNLAELLLVHKNDYIRSKTLCLKAIDTMADRPEVRLTMGRIYKRAGLVKNAEREFKLVLKLDKDNETAKMELEELG